MKLIIKCAVFELYAPKAKIEGVCSRSYCCYGNLVCHKIDNSVFNNDGQCLDTMIVASSDKDLKTFCGIRFL